MKNSKLLNVEKVIEDMKKLLLDLYEVKQIKDFSNYKGIEITHDKVLTTNQNIKESLSKESLDWMLIEHGRDALEIIILKIFQLGYQQGVTELEIEREERKKSFLSLQRLEDSLL